MSIDRFQERTDADLQTMSLADLQLYALDVSTVIGLQNSTLVSNQTIDYQYDYLILNTQSTIDGLSYEIMANSNLIIAANSHRTSLVNSNAVIDSTILLYQSSIDAQNIIINNADIRLATLRSESATIDSTLALSDAQFISSAIHYSSLFMNFVAADTVWTTRKTDINNARAVFDTAVLIEQSSLQYYNMITSGRVQKDAELSSLYITSNTLQNNLAIYKTNETLAISRLDSTNSAIVVISSLYETSITNQTYYQLLSTQGSVLDAYTAAYSTFMTASAMPNPTNDSVLVAATEMARQRLSTLTVTRSGIEARVATSLKLVTAAITDTYAATLDSAEAAVQREINNVRIFHGYKLSSMDAVTRWSTLYENAARDVASSLTGIVYYSTLYESSIAGSNAITAKVTAEQTSILPSTNAMNAASAMISTLNITYANYVSSYNGWISVSSILVSQIAQNNSDLTQYSTFYDSTVAGISALNALMSGIDNSIASNVTDLRIASTTMEIEIVKSLGYRRDICYYAGMEEGATFQYRETLVRKRRMDLQNDYNKSILAVIQGTSTTNGNLIAKSAGATVTLTPINLDVPSVNTPYSNLTTVNNFLATFTNIYTNYDTLATRNQIESTSIGSQVYAYSTFTSARDQYLLNPANVTLGQNYSNAQSAYITTQATTNQVHGDTIYTLGATNRAKTTFMPTYQTIFQAGDILNNESTISSFLIQGFNVAVTP